MGILWREGRFKAVGRGQHRFPKPGVAGSSPAGRAYEIDLFGSEEADSFQSAGVRSGEVEVSGQAGLVQGTFVQLAEDRVMFQCSFERLCRFSIVMIEDANALLADRLSSDTGRGPEVTHKFC